MVKICCPKIQSIPCLLEMVIMALMTFPEATVAFPMAMLGFPSFP